MASPELRRLWILHGVDAALAEIRVRAAGLDVGQKEAARIEELTKLDATTGKKSRDLHAEYTDLEIKQKGIDDKIAKFDKQLFGGTVVNPREVEAIEKEIAMLKRQRDANDERLLILMDELPPAKAEADKLEAEVAELKKRIALKRQAALQEKSRLEAAFKQESGRRPEAAKVVPPALLAKYEAIKKNHGTGMAEVVKRMTCGACGTLLPERTLQSLKEDKVVTCESCHRILYYTEGVV